MVIGDCDDDEDDDNDTHKSSRNMVVASRQNTETTFLKKPLVQKKVLDSKMLTFLLLFQRSYRYIFFYNKV